MIVSTRAKITALETLLNHHLIECRDRYTTYLTRHDNLVEQIRENSKEREEQLNDTRREMWLAMEQQTKDLRNLILKGMFAGFGAATTVAATAIWYTITHHV